jgi:hypothetical protein
LRFFGTIFDLIEHPEHLLDLLALIGLAVGAVLAFFVLAFPFCWLIDVLERRADRKRFARGPGQSERRRLQARRVIVASAAGRSRFAAGTQTASGSSAAATTQSAERLAPSPALASIFRVGAELIGARWQGTLPTREDATASRSHPPARRVTLPVQATNTRPRFEPTADAHGICSHAGVVLLAELADRLGLTSELGRRANLGLVRPGGSHAHDRGAVLRDLVVMLADGGDCVSDLAGLRDQAGLFGRVCSTATTWRVLGQVAADPRGVAGCR